MLKPGQNAAGKLSEWKTLVAVAEVVAAGQQIVGD